MSKLETNTIDNISGSSTLTIGDSNASTISIPKNITLGASGTTITVPSGATITNNGTQTGFGGTNTPYFQVNKTSNQTISNASTTKINSFEVVTESSSGVFDVINNKFTATVAGRYLFTTKTGFYDSDNNLKRTTIYVYKNNSEYRTTDFFMANGGIRNSTVCDSWVENVSVNDYFEIYALQNTTDSGTCVIDGTAYRTNFSGFKLI